MQIEQIQQQLQQLEQTFTQKAKYLKFLKSLIDQSYFIKPFADKVDLAMQQILKSSYLKITGDPKMAYLFFDIFIDQFTRLNHGALQTKSQVDGILILGTIVKTVNAFPGLIKLELEKKRADKICREILDMICYFSVEIQEVEEQKDYYFVKYSFEWESELRFKKPIRSFFRAFGFNNSVAMFQPLFKQYIQNNCKSMYCALVVASQLTVKEANVQALATIIQTALDLTKHPNHKMRSTALILIRQYNQNLDCEFQQTYFEKFMQISDKLLQDPNPEVLKQFIICLSYFYSKCNEFRIQKGLLNQQIKTIIQYIKKGDYAIREVCIRFLSAVTPITGSFSYNFKKMFKLAFQIVQQSKYELQNTDQNQLSRRVYKDLAQQCLNFISILIENHTTQKEQSFFFDQDSNTSMQFQKQSSYYLDQLNVVFTEYISQLFYFKQLIKPSIFFNCWVRICQKCSYNIDIGQYYPVLFKVIAQNALKDEKPSAGLACLRYTLEKFNIKHPNVLNEAVKLVQRLFKQKSNYLQEALLLQISISFLINSNIPVTHPAFIKKANKMYFYFTGHIENFYSCKMARGKKTKDPQATDLKIEVKFLSGFYTAILQLLSRLSNCHLEQFIQKFSKKQFLLLQALKKYYDNACSDKKEPKQFLLLQALKKYYDDTCSNKKKPKSKNRSSLFAWEKIQEKPQIISILKDVLRKKALILKMLIKSVNQRDMKRIIYNSYINNLTPYLQDPFLGNFAQETLMDAKTIFSYNDIKPVYVLLMDKLFKCIKSTDAKERNLGVYGFKIIFSKMDTDSFNSQQLSMLLELLSKSFTAQFGYSQDLDHQSFIKGCKENVISALGSLLKYFGPSHPSILNQEIYKFWLNNLPLSADSTDGDQQQQFLIEILAKSPPLIINEPKDFLTICQIYAKFVMKRRHKKFEEVVNKTKKSFLMIKQWKQFKQSESYLQQNLNGSHKTTLKKLIAN